MSYQFAVGKDSNTGKEMVLVGGLPEPVSEPLALALCRMLKHCHPKIFRQVQYEMEVPVNGGRAALHIPDEIGEKRVEAEPGEDLCKGGIVLPEE